MIAKWSSIVVVLLLVLGIWVHQLWRIPSIAAHGQVAGFPIAGAVDSPVARDLVQGRPLASALETLRKRLREQRRSPTAQELKHASEKYSPDVAALLFLESMSVSPAGAEFRRRFEAQLDYVRDVGVESARPQMAPNLRLLMVPGWFYKENSHETNADYRIQRALFRRWGVPHELVRTDQNGSVEENAHSVVRAIRKLPDGEKAFLVSASKSSGEVAVALSQLLDENDARRVSGWLSIGGVVTGSALADRILEPDLCWLIRLKLETAGFDLKGLQSMSTSHRRAIFHKFALPKHVDVYSFIPVPLSGQITSRGELGYRLMRAAGPNDGLTLLADELIPGAIPILAPGLDHFLGSPDEQVIWSTALFRTILEPHQR